MSLIVNGETVDDSAIRQEVALLREYYGSSLEGDPVEIEMELREQARENVIGRTLLRQEARRDSEPIAAERIEEALAAVRAQSAVKAGCDPRASDEELRQEIEARLRVDRLMEKITARISPPRPKDVGEYYRKHREEFVTPEMVRASHIVKNVDESTTEEAALEAIRQVEALLGPDNFAALADEHSDCKGNGGDLGWFPRGQMVEEFEEMVFAMHPGETSAIFRSPFGFHIARVTGRRAAGPRGLAEVQEEIQDLLHREKQRRALRELVERLRAKADVQNVRQQVKV